MSECISETLLLGIHRSRYCEPVSSKWWRKWHLVCRNHTIYQIYQIYQMSPSDD